jgi:hypothetical protein
VSPPPSGAASCGALSIHVQTKASCGLAFSGGAGLDAEGFIHARACTTYQNGPTCREPVPLGCHRILAMTRLGAGHIIGWCDSTTLGELLAQMDAFTYLGATAAPRVASVGRCPPKLPGVPGATYLGLSLPDAYASSPEALAADWDALVVCSAPGELGGPWQTSLLRYVRDLGKGAFFQYDYILPPDASVPDLVAMNAITGEAGFVFEPIDLEWAPLGVDLPCVADYP